MRGAWPDCSVNTTIEYKIKTPPVTVTQAAHLHFTLPFLSSSTASFPFSCILSHGLSITYFLPLSFFPASPPPPPPPPPLPNSHMVHLLSCGYVLPVVDYISSRGGKSLPSPFFQVLVPIFEKNFGWEYTAILAPPPPPPPPTSKKLSIPLSPEEVRNADSACPFLPSRQYKKGHAESAFRDACRTSSALSLHADGISGPLPHSSLCE